MLPEIIDVWSPKIQSLNRIKAALGEHRLLATRRIHTGNFRQLADILPRMEVMRAAIEAGLDAYAGKAQAEDERAVLMDTRVYWLSYQNSLKSVAYSLDIGEITRAFANFEDISLAHFGKADAQLDALLNIAKDRSIAAETRVQAAFERALLLTIAAAIAAAVLAYVASLWASRRVSRPIMEVSQAMSRLTQGDHSAGIGTGDQRHDEIGILIAAVKGYRDSLMSGRRLAALAETERERLRVAVTNMPIGLAMFDPECRLIVCNERYGEMYRLPLALTEPGTSLDRILRERVRKGVFMGADSNKFIEDTYAMVSQSERTLQFAELNDGRSLSVIFQPMQGGGWVSTHEDVTERRRAEARIQHMARHDSLTDLPNRTLLRDRADEALKLVARGECVAVMCMDLDRFKAVNDTLGHPMGDAVLRIVAERICGAIRDVDTVARFGGDEFAVIQVGVDQPQSATALAERLIEVLSAPYHVEGQQVMIGCSIGIAVAPLDGLDPDELLKKADMALYRSKVEGRGTFRFFEATMDARMQARRALEIDLRKALVDGEFELHYQPVIDLKSGNVAGFEALLRWNHPVRGRVSPADFIPLAEDTALTVPIGDWVLRQACADAASWPGQLNVAVNLSSVQFQKEGLVRTVVAALAASGLPPHRLELEITESALLVNTNATMAMLHQLRALGARVCMDDFGTGYSSLSYLRSFPFDKIKIDQSFVRDITSNKQSLAIVQAVTRLGMTLGIATTAEGVETGEQLEELRSQCCTEVQGFYFSVPKPVGELRSLLATIGAGSERAA
jgi:diguanylate cyclase (GGDEF)-like protein